MPAPSTVVRHRPSRRLGLGGTGHHFFGYYNKSVWDRSGRYVLAHRVPTMDADLQPGSVAEVGCFDLHDGAFRSVARTTAWNWQMGCQLQWLDGSPRREFIYNCRTPEPPPPTQPQAVYEGFGATVCELDSGEKRHLPLPVYSVSPDSRWALCVSYRRLAVTHPTIGYVEARPPERPAAAPADDGIHRMDLASGAHRLIVSYDRLRRFHPVASMAHALHWVSHIEIHPASSRFLFLHRWTERVEDETCFLHRLITANPDGSDLRLLEDSDHPLPQLDTSFDPTAVGTYDYEKSEHQISHPMWCADGRIVVWSPHRGRIHYHLYDDADGGAVRVIGRDILTENGHMSYSPVDPRWLLSDTYPDPRTNERVLFLYDTRDDRRIDLGSFYADPALRKENRCDLHPRWSRDGRSVCIDSVHESERQMYLIDVSDLTGQA